MIKINLANTEEINQKHLNGLKEEVEKKLDNKIKDEGDTPLGKLLEYLKGEINVLLCGKRSELIKIVQEVEGKHFISESKLTEILRKRGSVKGMTKTQKSSFLTNYAKEKNIFNYLTEEAYSSVTQFEKEVKDLTEFKWKNYKDTLKKTFNYEAFSGAEEGWSAYELVSALDVSVCPYCNRSFITTLMKEDEEGKKTRPELDHYYPKSRYPYLALSLNNLIPSCSVCNGSLKGTVDFYEEDAIHPYEEEFLNVASFKTDFGDNAPYDYKYLLGLSKEFSITFEINTEDKKLEKRVKKAIKTFALDRLYNKHQDFVRDLIRNGIVNNKSRIDELYKNFEGDLFNSREEVMQSVFLNYLDDQDLGKRPLAKLTQDICRELGLLDTQINK